MSTVLRAVVATLFLWSIPSSVVAQEENEATASLGADTSATYEYLEANGFPFYATIEEFATAVHEKKLVRLNRTDVYVVTASGGWQFVHPIVAIFAERLGKQYNLTGVGNQGCGRLILTRGFDNRTPVLKEDRQSLYASGLLLDIEVPQGTLSQCVDWLESTLLLIEENGRIDMSKRGKTYSVAVRVNEYEAWLIENTDYEPG